jgi:ANTAR domain
MTNNRTAKRTMQTEHRHQIDRRQGFRRNVLEIPEIARNQSRGRHQVGVELLMHACAAPAAVLVEFDRDKRCFGLTAQARDHPRVRIGFLEKALRSRSDIDMAKGALIALHGCEPDETFAKLVDESQRRNIKLRDVALEMLDRMKAYQGTP